MNFVVMFIATVVIAVECNPVAETQHTNLQSGQKLYDSVAPNDQEHFLVLHLALGLIELEKDLESAESTSPAAFNLPGDIDIPEETFDRLTDMNVSPSFSRNILRWAKAEFNMTDDDVVKFVNTKEICLPSGCFNPGDVGSVCCPFIYRD